MFPYTLIDLTHTIHPDMPSWNGGCGFWCETKLDYDPAHHPSFRVQQFKIHAGIGTHMDLPSHCVPGGTSAHDMPLSKCVGPVVVIDVRDQAHENYSVGVDDIQKFEAMHGALQQDACVLIWTGWGRYWYDAERYRNDYLFPSVSRDAALYMLDHGVSGLGIDTLSPDCPCDGFPVHEAFLGADKYILENVTHVEHMPTTGGFIMALPMKVEGGTEAPVRCVGLVPKIYE